MKNAATTLLLTLTATTLTGCGWLTGDDGLFRDRQDDYRQAALEAPLTIPEGMSGSAISDELAVPGTTTGPVLSGSFEVPRPEPLSGALGGETVRLQRLGDDRWILVEAAPGEVWPRVRQFLGVNQLAVDRIDAETGVIETDWLQPRGGETQERYRFRIEQGVQRNSSEILVLQSQAPQGWPQRSTQPEREAEMMKALAQFIADSGSTGSVSMLAQRAFDARGRVFLERRGEQPTLRLDLPVERGWASLDAALPKAGFIIESSDSDARQLQVRYAPQQSAEADTEEERGWLSSLWRSVAGDDEEDAGADADEIYQLSVVPLGGDRLRIAIERQDGTALAPSRAEALLLQIKSKLS